MRISDWSSDVCSSDLGRFVTARTKGLNLHRYAYAGSVRIFDAAQPPQFAIIEAVGIARVRGELRDRAVARGIGIDAARQRQGRAIALGRHAAREGVGGAPDGDNGPAADIFDRRPERADPARAPNQKP